MFIAAINVSNKVKQVCKFSTPGVYKSPWKLNFLRWFHRDSWHSSATLTEVFPCFFLSCKANTRLLLSKTGHGLHSSTDFCVYLCIVCFVSLCALFVCIVVSCLVCIVVSCLVCIVVSCLVCIVVVVCIVVSCLVCIVVVVLCVVSCLVCIVVSCLVCIVSCLVCIVVVVCIVSCLVCIVVVVLCVLL